MSASYNVFPQQPALTFIAGLEDTNSKIYESVSEDVLDATFLMSVTSAKRNSRVEAKLSR